MDSYKIVRFYADPKISKRVIDTGLTLEEAQEHCEDPESSSTTCTSSSGRKRTREKGPWFDGFTEETR